MYRTDMHSDRSWVTGVSYFFGTQCRIESERVVLVHRELTASNVRVGPFTLMTLNMSSLKTGVRLIWKYSRHTSQTFCGYFPPLPCVLHSMPIPSSILSSWITSSEQKQNEKFLTWISPASCYSFLLGDNCPHNNVSYHFTSLFYISMGLDAVKFGKQAKKTSLRKLVALFSNFNP